MRSIRTLSLRQTNSISVRSKASELQPGTGKMLCSRPRAAMPAIMLRVDATPASGLVLVAIGIRLFCIFPECYLKVLLRPEYKLRPGWEEHYRIFRFMLQAMPLPMWILLLRE